MGRVSIFWYASSKTYDGASVKCKKNYIFSTFFSFFVVGGNVRKDVLEKIISLNVFQKVSEKLFDFFKQKKLKNEGELQRSFFF